MILKNDELNIYKSGPTIALNKGGPVLNHDRNKLNDIFDNLPEDLKDAIASVDSAEAIFETSKKYNLHVDQTAILGQETGLVLLGVSDPMEFVGSIVARLGIDKNKASNIVMEINEKIFAKVKESLRAIHAGQKVFTVGEKTETQSNIMKKVERESLNVPRKTMDILEGKITETKKQDTSILGFQATSGMDILEKKINEPTEIPKTETDVRVGGGGIAPDPYREMM